MFMPRLLGTAVLIIATVMAPEAMAADVAGRVLLAAGDALAIRSGRAVRLTRGDEIRAHDLLRTGRNSNLQVRMSDSGIISLRPDSALSIEDYVYHGRPDGSENAFFRLLKGGFRTITGLIGRVNKSAYHVRTGVATIGIRGTAYALALCDAGSCQSAPGKPAADGLYGTVTEGRIVAANKATQISLAAGQTFYAANRDAPFQRLLAPPPFLSDRLRGEHGGTSRRSADHSERTGAPGSDKSATEGREEPDDSTQNSGHARRRPRDARPGAIVQTSRPPEPLASVPEAGDAVPLPSEGTDTTAPLTGSGTALPPVVSTESLTSSGGLSVLPPADGFVVSYPTPGAGIDVFFGDKDEAVFTTANYVVQFMTSAATGALGPGTVVDKGHYALGNQVITWGRWNGGGAVTSDGTYTNVPLLFATANGVSGTSTLTSNMPPSTLGLVTYVGGLGPRPTASMPGFTPDQIAGSVVNESLAIDFTRASAQLSMDLSFTASNTNGTLTRAYALSGTGGPTQGPNGGDLGGTLSVTCTAGCAGTGPASGKFSIGLTGPNGYELAVTAGGIRDTSSNFSASFLRIFHTP
ncbi:MAG: hypothetical protein GC151_13425 [Betaproteobacteria bacterium]|nr:hypothetical protein [Betaproteobacteria bacterium]